jgi:hypothetical protein
MIKKQKKSRIKALYSSIVYNGDTNFAFNSFEDFKTVATASILSANQYYDCYFVGCKESCKIMKDLELPFVSITEIDPREDLNLWNKSKLISCMMTEPPFFHIDFDVILTKRLSDFEGYYFQDKELFTIHDHYNGAKALFKKVEKYNEAFPADIEYGYNLGIIGIKDDFALNAWRRSLEVLINDLDYLELYRTDCFCEIAVEQYSIACVAEAFHIPVKLIIENEQSYSERERDLSYTKQVKDSGYVHLLASTKRDPKNIQIVKNYLKKRFNYEL